MTVSRQRLGGRGRAAAAAGIITNQPHVLHTSTAKCADKPCLMQRLACCSGPWRAFAENRCLCPLPMRHTLSMRHMRTIGQHAGSNHLGVVWTVAQHAGPNHLEHVVVAVSASRAISVVFAAFLLSLGIVTSAAVCHGALTPPTTTTPHRPPQTALSLP